MSRCIVFFAQGRDEVEIDAGHVNTDTICAYQSRTDQHLSSVKPSSVVTCQPGTECSNQENPHRCGDHRLPNIDSYTRDPDIPILRSRTLPNSPEPFSPLQSNHTSHILFKMTAAWKAAGLTYEFTNCL